MPHGRFHPKCPCHQFRRTAPASSAKQAKQSKQSKASRNRVPTYSFLQSSSRPRRAVVRFSPYLDPISHIRRPCPPEPHDLHFLPPHLILDDHTKQQLGQHQQPTDIQYITYFSARAARYSFISSADSGPSPTTGLHSQLTAPDQLRLGIKARHSGGSCHQPFSRCCSCGRQGTRPACFLLLPGAQAKPSCQAPADVDLHTSSDTPFPLPPIIPLIHIPGPAADAVSCIIRSARPLPSLTAPLPIALGARRPSSSRLQIARCTLPCLACGCCLSLERSATRWRGA
ncbi:hypothetical protein B0T21DRAFT_26925 [Apiosordaria backusii]|uniref:Uncharacterized protein n=1 Tax=Apiosordaria backusii TaxID=314023 RepID=A0AA40K7C9_9PEZI|nr:hypothetical protein B0T21DRAFT_26925 [Apiosordaria backusii]